MLAHMHTETPETHMYTYIHRDAPTKLFFIIDFLKNTKLKTINGFKILDTHYFLPRIKFSKPIY